MNREVLPSAGWVIAVRVAFAVIAAGLVACVGASIVVPGSFLESNEQLIDLFVYSGAGALALVACLVRALKVRVERVVWLAIAVAIAAWLVGTVISSKAHVESESGHHHSETTEQAMYEESEARNRPEARAASVTRKKSVPRRAVAAAPQAEQLEPRAGDEKTGLRDSFYMLFLLAGAVGLAALVRARMKPFQPTILLDGTIVALAVAALGAALEQVLVGGRDPGLLESSLPLVSLALLAFLGWTLAVLGRKAARVWLWLIGGLAFAGIASAIDVGRVVTGGEELSLLEGLWPAAMLMFAVAAWQEPQAPERPRLEGRIKTMAVSMAASAALALMALSYLPGIGTIALLLSALTLSLLIARATFAFRENQTMVLGFQHQAQSDFLTGLGNRRKLMVDLHREITCASEASPRMLMLFDLDGFKSYNDTFGHPAGDALLQRLGNNLDRASASCGYAYRLGGDEFCVLVTSWTEDAATTASKVSKALSEEGVGFTVTASGGTVTIPREARDASTALRLADQRMYSRKESRHNSSSRQTRDILMQVLREREPDLGDHMNDVAVLSRRVGARLGLVGEALDEVVRAAELHDIGKMAIPDQILHKPAALDEAEWQFMKEHTIVGERILQAAPALSPVAKLVRASHERWDGNGYPDRVPGERIPLGARIVSACDAFDAMTSERAYCSSVPAEDALAELRANSGRQFDPAVVEALCKEVEGRGTLSTLAA